jgi:hypothetical protein
LGYFGHFDSFVYPLYCFYNQATENTHGESESAHFPRHPLYGDVHHGVFDNSRNFTRAGFGGRLDIACMLDIYLFSIGFSMTFAALFSKTWRINIVHASARKCRRVTIRATDVLLPFTVLMVLNMTILITWTIVAPL